MMNGSLDSHENSESSLVCLFSSTGGASIFYSQHVDSYIFVATWNVGGLSPHNGLNLDDFLQGIVPLNAGNVLVLEDNEPVAKWLALVNQSLNKPSKVALRGTPSVGGSLFFTKPSLKKACNCPVKLEKKHSNELCCSFQQLNNRDVDFSLEEDDDGLNSFEIPSNNHMKYNLVASKQMLRIFLTIWIRKELVQYVSHLRTCCISRGIMGCLRNKTSFYFVCNNLASGEKEGDEIRRNQDVIEILRNTQFPNIYLNYQISLSYSETKKLFQSKSKRCKKYWNKFADFTKIPQIDGDSNK
ncbi:hypothetical protein UlMin_045374 [Ulmus minor]